jgi:hypothetical protein
MSECLDADALLAIGHALDWRIEEGLIHFQTCADCRAQLETLQLTREGLLASTPVESETLRRVAAMLHDAGAREIRDAGRGTRHQVAEACAAGVTALITLASIRAPLESPATAVIAFSLGAILMVAGTSLARRLTSLSTW